MFFIEYAGPLLIHPFFYYCQTMVYGKSFEHTREQQITFVAVMFHFIKRELESAYVHRFSNDTMPFWNIFKNSGHYWILSGLSLAYFGYKEDNRAPLPDAILYIACFIWLYAQISNFLTHLNLASLRSPGSKERKIPYGYGFELVSCPNYFFEILGWLAICVISRSLAAVVFFTVSSVTLWFWAVKKHKRYRREFSGKYPKNRKILFPGLA